MNPIFGIIAIIWIVRALTGGFKSQSGAVQTSNRNIVVSPAIVIWFVKFGVFVLAPGVARDLDKPVLAHVLEITAVPFLLPTLFLQWLLVPLGLVRCAYWWSRCSWPSGFGKEFRVAAVYYGALALARTETIALRAEKIAWLRRRLPDKSPPSVGQETVIALLAALAGERDTAQAIMQSIDTTLGPRRLRCMARDWLVMDAVRRGEWQEAIWRGRRARDSFRWSYAVARMAERMDGRAMAARDWQLVALWLLAPRRRRLRPLLRMATATPRGEKKTSPARPFPKDLPAALADLATMLLQFEKTGQAPDREHFLAVGRWANLRAESPAVHIHAQERLKALDPLRNDARESTDAIVRNLQVRLADMLVPIIEQAPHLVTGEVERPVIAEAVERVRQAGMQYIEVRCRDYDSRVKSQSNLERQEEWGAWAALRKRADQLLKMDKGAEDALFQLMYTPLCNFAVYQHNTVTNHRLAHDMFCWLREHAKSNREASDLLARNMMAYPGRRLR